MPADRFLEGAAASGDDLPGPTDTRAGESMAMASAPSVPSHAWLVVRRLSDGLLRVLTIERAALILLVVALAPIVFPFLHAGFLDGHDMSAHVTYVYRFDQALHQGQFPVRWVEGLRPGDNQPLFNFYQVGFYYLVELVHLVVPRLSVSLYVTVVVLWIMATAFVFSLFRRCGVVAAAMAAIIFGLSPYLIIDALVRAAYPELAGIAFAMGVLWALDRWLTSGRRRSVVMVAGFVGMTLLCHLPVVLIVAPMIAGHVLWLVVTRQTTTARVTMLIPAALLGAGLAAFYVMPALLELDQIQIKRMTQGSMNFHESFVPPMRWFKLALAYDWPFGTSVSESSVDLLPVHISFVHWVAMVAAVAVSAVAVARRRVDWRVAGLIEWLAVSAFAMFMMTASAAFIWNAVPALPYIQYPWRFFMLLSVSGAALSALTLSMVSSRRIQIALLILTVAVQVHLYHRRLKPGRYVEHSVLNIDDPAWRYSAEARQSEFYEIAYDPLGVTRMVPPPAGRWALAGGPGSVVAETVTDAALVLASRSEAPMTLRVNSRAFPGWVATIDGRAATIATRPGDGYMEVVVPAGAHRIAVRFTNTPVRAAANAISILSVALLMIGSATLAIRHLRRRPPTDLRRRPASDL